MKFCSIIFVLLASVAASAQTQPTATPVYASNGTLVGLSNLVGLSDCKSENVDGKLRELRVNADKASFRLVKKHKSVDVEVDLSHLSPGDRTAALRDLLRKSNPLRVAGYRCSSDLSLTAFSVDRIY